MKRFFCVLLIAAIVLCGCSSTETTSTEEAVSGINFTDMIGRNIVLDKVPERILALSPSDCEILCAIGAGEQLIGRATECDWPQEILELPAIESGVNMNLEQVIAMKPDVVLMSSITQTEAQQNVLENAGITVIYSDGHDNSETLEGVYKAISLLGTVSGREEAAQKLVADTKQTFSDLQASIPDGEKKTVYFEVSPLKYGLWTCGPGTYMNEICELLGVENIFSDLEGWCEVSEEQVLDRNPDYIVSVIMYYDEGLSPEEDISSRNGWDSITAVKNGNIINFSNNELTRPSHRLAEGAKILFDFFYGE